ncbi:MAG: hypothetical protein ACYC5G_04140 [Candidatus Doudnabacteria bacterium]
METKRKLIAGLFIALALTTTSSIFFIPKETQAISLTSLCGGVSGMAGRYLTGLVTGFVSSLFGSSEVPTDDKKTNATELLKSCVADMIRAENHKYTLNYVNDVIKKYKISDYLEYQKNLANTLYLSKQLKSREPEDVFLAKANIRRILSVTEKSIKNVDLKPVYKKRALNAVDFSKVYTSTSNAAASVLEDPLVSTPQGQKLAAEAQAETDWLRAQSGAAANIQNSEGNKDQIDCSSKDSKGNAVCNIKASAKFVSDQIDSKISEIFGEQLKPQDHVDVMQDFIKILLGNKKTPAQKIGDPIKDQPSSLQGDFMTEDPTAWMGN